MHSFWMCRLPEQLKKNTVVVFYSTLCPWYSKPYDIVLKYAVFMILLTLWPLWPCFKVRCVHDTTDFMTLWPLWPCFTVRCVHDSADLMTFMTLFYSTLCSWFCWPYDLYDIVLQYAVFMILLTLWPLWPYDLILQYAVFMILLMVTEICMTFFLLATDAKVSTVSLSVNHLSDCPYPTVQQSVFLTLVEYIS